MQTIPNHSRVTHAARGFTLLEVILALAILTIALASIGSLTGLSTGNAKQAMVESEATIIAESIMAELETGLILFEDIDNALWVSDDTQSTHRQESEYQYSIKYEVLTQFPTMANVWVRVEQVPSGPETPLGVDLYRWLPNPQATTTTNETDTSTTGASSTSSSTGQ